MSLTVIHTADWHLGQTFFGYDREEEHDAFLAWLLDTLAQRAADVLLIAGDVFDVANPSASAQRRFFRFLREANRRIPHLQIVVVAGNHDSATRLEAPLPLLEELHTHIIGIIPRTDTGQIDFDSLLLPLYNKEGGREALCLTVPYLRQGDYPAPEGEEAGGYAAGIARMYAALYAHAERQRKRGEALLATGHLHATGAELSDDDRSERVILGGLECVTADSFPTGLAYTALGHIHKAQRVGGREEVRYSGSPLPMSFSEQHYRHQVVEVRIEAGRRTGCTVLPVPLTTPLLRMPAAPASPEAVLLALQSLPPADVSEGRSRCPYLEVQVLLSEPDPGFRHRVEETLADKAVRLTSIVPSYPKREGEEAVVALTFKDLQKINPTDMLRHAFANRFGGELPEELATLFNQVMREVSL